MKNVIFSIIACGLIVGGFIYALDRQSAMMEQYAIEHNCTWQYNDLCVENPA